MKRPVYQKMLSMAMAFLLAVSMTVGVLPVKAADAAQTVEYYGRSGLATLPNSTALLYAYDQIASGVENSAAVISVYNGTNTITNAEVRTVMQAYRSDYAHHFWIGNTYYITSQSNTVLHVKPQYLFAGSDLTAARQAFDLKVAAVLNGVQTSWSEYEKELYLHDTLAGMIEYESTANSGNAYGALIEGKAVCEGYAEALQYLLQKVGVQSYIVTGNAVSDDSTEAHAWNLVRIDGRYYYTDLTWDDQGDTLYHAYFNQSAAVMSEDHMASVLPYGLPACNSVTAQYFTGKDTYLSSFSVQQVADLLKNNQQSVHVYTPGSTTDLINWYYDNIRSIATAMGVNGAFSYGYSRLGHEVILRLQYSHTHTGGSANCVSGPLCSVCGTEYGSKNAANHLGSAKWAQTAVSHSKAYDCCGVFAVQPENHHWVNGVCSECSYTCTHTGGSATCTDKAACTVCGSKYGNINTNNHTGTAAWTKTATKHSKAYSCCGAGVVTEENHHWVNGVCSECSYTCTHTGGSATCTDKAACTVCGSKYGNTDTNNHTGSTSWNRTANNHSKVYSCCGATVSGSSGGHIYTDSKDTSCNTCGYIRTVAVRTVPMYRMYDPNSSEHFYTGSTEERDVLVKAGWNYEGVGFNFPVSGSPVHRLYEPKTGEHLYTMDESEMNSLLKKGWNYEGVAFNSAKSNEVPQYRLHNPNASRGAYHFTGSIEERDWLMSLGWQYQGIGWYSCLR